MSVLIFVFMLLSTGFDCYLKFLDNVSASINNFFNVFVLIIRLKVLMINMHFLYTSTTA